MIRIDQNLNLMDFMCVVERFEPIELSSEAKERIEKSAAYVRQAGEEGKVVYGVTTGLGANSEIAIDSSQTEIFQRNILRSHATSVGRAMTQVEVRALMLAIVVHGVKGYSGVRVETLQRYIDMLNQKLYPVVPCEGSVGYLSPESHLGLVAIGEGNIFVEKEEKRASEVFEGLGWAPLVLTYKEALFLISGTTSATALAAVGGYRSLRAAASADRIAALTIEMSGGNIRAFDPGVMSIRKQPEQGETAQLLRESMGDAQIYQEGEQRLQDALSLRCVPQVHGAAKEKIKQSLDTIERELKSCMDNPVILEVEEGMDTYSSGNPDASYIGLAADCLAIADTMIAKMSERRTFRMLDSKLSGYPAFLVRNPGLNNGLMIPQYTQAGLLNTMKGLCMPAVVDSIPTCANQEDYVSMGYNAAYKLQEVTKNLEYILAIELLTSYQLYQFVREQTRVSARAKELYARIERHLPPIESDVYLYDYIEQLKNMIHQGELL